MFIRSPGCSKPAFDGADHRPIRKSRSDDADESSRYSRERKIDHFASRSFCREPCIVPELHDAADDSNHSERKGQKHLPAQPHQLIVAVTRNNRFNEREHEEYEQALEHEPDHSRIQVNGMTPNGGSQPPRNKIVVMAQMVKIAMYSPRKNRRNGVAEYSTA